MISSIARGDCRPHTVPELCQKRGGEGEGINQSTYLLDGLHLRFYIYSELLIGEPGGYERGNSTRGNLSLLCVAQRLSWR